MDRPRGNHIKTLDEPRARRDGLRVITETTDEALSAIADEWDELYRHCPHATPFQTSAWLVSWWREYGQPGALRLLLARRAGVLVGALPLMAVRSAGMTVLQPVGTGISDWTDALVHPDVADDVLQAFRTTLLADRGWHALDFPEVAPGAAVHRLFDLWSHRKLIVPASLCQELVAAPIDELASTLSRSGRANVRRALRKIDDAGVMTTIVPDEELPAALRRLMELHLRQWSERGAVSAEHKRSRFARHLTRAATTMARRGEAVVCEYRIGGSLVASNLFLLGPHLVGGYLYGADPKLYQQFNVTTMIIRTGMELAVEAQRPVLGLMRGSESYKSEWRPTTFQNDRLIVCRPRSLIGLLYLGWSHLRTVVVPALSARAPRLAVAGRWGRRRLRSGVALLRTLTGSVQPDDQ